MFYFIKTFAQHKIVFTILILLGGACQLSFGQVTGPSPVDSNSTHTYYFDDGLSHKNPSWLIDGGVKLSSGNVGTEYYVNVQWGSAGIGSVTITSGFVLLDGMNVTIGSTIPSAPTMPTITNYPGYTRLTRGTPPSGEIWYWQDTLTGTSTLNSSTYVDKDTGTEYYLSSYKSSTDQWSSATTINYTVNPPTTSSSNENYIHTISPRTETTDVSLLVDQQKIESITYFDGLGRPMQAIGMRAGGTGQDIITHIEYDQYGRQAKDYLPYSATTNIGLYRSDGLSATNTHYLQSKYSADINSVAPNPYSEKEFEASPLNRIFKQAAPGYDWRLNGDHEIKFDYQTNILNEVKLYKVTLSYANNTYTPTLSLSGSYTAGELYKTITKDENWTSGTNHTTEEFKDKQGRVILKRTYNNGAHDTYYVYDDYGNLSYVLPPKAEPQTALPDATELSELCYQYKYDHRNRLVEKKIPGKEWEYIVYNKLDQPILTQDANLKTQNKWLFTKYDAFGRVAYTGEMTRNISRINLQTEVNNLQEVNNISSQYVTKQSTSTIIDGTTIYYNNGAYPIADITDILTINYYDNYTFDKVAGNSETSYTVTPITNAKGLATGSKVRVLTTNDWITTVTYYDAKSRPIYVYSFNDYLDTTDKVKSKLDFTGQVEETTTTHARTNFSTITTVDKFTYDHQGRLLTQTNKINTLSEETIVSNTYDELGQLISKGVGGKTIQGRLQTVDYTYNIRGWLKQINNPTTLGTDLFAFKINYNSKDITATTGYMPLYNGNISETIWKTANDVSSNKTRGYAYKYDALNRITGADYGVKTTGSYSLASGFDVGIGSYDKNGNIMSLWRDDATNGHRIDQLTYTYQAYSNKLNIVSDVILNTTSLNEEFKDDYNSTSADTTTDYTYDANGNMISDANKGITGILYNYWDLPTEVKFNNSNTQKINYTYDAVGTKLRKVVNENGNITTTDYANSFVYKNGVLQFFEHPEGYVDAVNGYKYVYNYKDHLGNVRLVYSDSDNSGSVDSSEIIDEKNYYPFGLEHQGYNTNINGVENNHLTYNGKEFDKSLNLNTFDLGARQMDPALGRFMVIDPMADFVNYQSPYAVADNNPIGNIDFYGLGKTPWWLRWLLGGGGADCGCTQHEGVVGFIGRLFDPKPGKTGGGKKPKPPKKKGTKPDPKFANGDRDPISPIDFGNNGLADLKDLEIAAPQLGSLSMPKEESVKIRVGGKRYEPNEKIEVNIGFYQSQFKIKGSEITGKILNDIIKTLKEWPHLKVIIYGNIWSSKGNVNKNSEHNSLEGKMSVGDFQKGRANAILIFLEKRGISRSRIKVESGEISPNSKGASTTVEFID